MDALAEQYLRWKSGVAQEEDEDDMEVHHFEVTAISTFCESCHFVSFSLLNSIVIQPESASIVYLRGPTKSPMLP